MGTYRPADALPNFDKHLLHTRLDLEFCRFSLMGDIYRHMEIAPVTPDSH
jgi:hypothetical protein